jgi:hypothetical protein
MGGVNQMLILENSTDLLQIPEVPCSCHSIKNVNFSIIYITIPHANVNVILQG